LKPRDKFRPPIINWKMIPNPHVSNNTNERLKVFQFATLNIWIKKEWIIYLLSESASVLWRYWKPIKVYWCCGPVLSDDVIQRIERTLNNTDTTTEKRTKNGFRNSKKQSNVLSNSGYNPWYYATLLRIWGWPFKGCKSWGHRAPSFFPCDCEYLWRIGKSQTHRDAETLVLTKNSKIRDW